MRSGADLHDKSLGKDVVMISKTKGTEAPAPDATEEAASEPHVDLTGPLEEQAAHLYFAVGAWNDRVKPDGMFYPKARAEAMETIDAMLDQLGKLRSALIGEGIKYQEELLARPVRDLGECSREGCDRPAIEGRPGYEGPLYCGPRCAFVDRPNREGGAA
jgi:hypothetical protein